MKDIHEIIRNYVVNSFLFGDGKKLGNDTSFLGNSIIDSTGMLELISYIEQEFGISIDDAELVPENLDSIDNVASFISRKKGP